jgi:CHAD domain-containing protein
MSMVTVEHSLSQEGDISEPKVFLVRDYAFQSLYKNFRKSVKHEQEVFADQDPEGIHQMRVGMRRLRTALAVFSPFVSLPSNLNQDITKLSKSLGSVRDLDVLGIWFNEYRNLTTPSIEEEQLATILQKLERQRKKQFKRLGRALKGKRYEHFTEGLRQWLENPVFLPRAEWPIRLVLPDIILPLINQLLLHPGWMVATSGSLELWKPETAVDFNSVNADIAQYGPALHDLRKQAKRVRYQTEFFVDFYAETYRQQTQEFRTIQDLLGQIQDSQVLSDFLSEEIGKDWAVQIPSLNHYFHQQRSGLWLQWRNIQQKYLKTDFREHLRKLVEEQHNSQEIARSN